jgi:hypothetical protein
MKLPRDFRAALTLGANLCKDKLVQAAMRMRQLGHGQTVVFVMPQEISTKIHRLTRKPNKRALKVEDVLFWCIAESWAELKKCMPIWSVQGVRFEAQKQHWKGIDTKRGQAEAYLEPEAQTLEARYRPAVQDIDGSGKIRDWDTTNPNIAEIVQRCQNFGAMGFSSADLDEEQEVRLRFRPCQVPMLINRSVSLHLRKRKNARYILLPKWMLPNIKFMRMSRH